MNRLENQKQFHVFVGISIGEKERGLPEWLMLSHSAASDPCDPLDCSPPGSSVHRILQARIPGGLPFLLQGIFPTQGLNPCVLCFLHWQAGSLPLAPPGKPFSRDKEFACQGKRQGFNAWVRKIPLERVIATHSSILAWEVS